MENPVPAAAAAAAAVTAAAAAGLPSFSVAVCWLLVLLTSGALQHLALCLVAGMLLLHWLT
jgi:hypothetical protein